MVIKKIQIRPKGNGTYSDILYPETSGEQVLMNDGQNLEQRLNAVVTTSQKGAAGGVAPLDEGSKINRLYLPTDSFIEPRTNDPVGPATGRIWLRTDL